MIVTDHFVVEVYGMTQNIPIEYLSNGHRAGFYVQDRLICFFTHKDQLGQIDPKKRLRVKNLFILYYPVILLLLYLKIS